jgi:hypothetical protein
MFCQECGTKRVEGAPYCPGCGAPLEAQGGQHQSQQTRVFEPEAAAHASASVLQPAGARSGLMKRPLRWRRLTKGCLMATGALFAMVIGCAGVSAVLEDSDDHRTVAARAESHPALEDHERDAGFESSEQQQAFIRMIEDYSERYREAENELQSSARRSERQAALAKLLPDREVHEWTGTLESLDTDSRGNAYITITPDGAEDMTIATWNNALADADTQSMIPSGSELFEELATMREGERVIFSGTFVADDQDHIAEGSLTEDKAMTTPDFVMVFSEIRAEEE